MEFYSGDIEMLMSGWNTLYMRSVTIGWRAEMIIESKKAE
jgi:hypothetical protein